MNSPPVNNNMSTQSKGFTNSSKSPDDDQSNSNPTFNNQNRDDLIYEESNQDLQSSLQGKLLPSLQILTKCKMT